MKDGKELYMSTKIYVGNLNYATSEDTLKSAFTQFGEVDSVSVIRDRFTQQSKGFAFVEMQDDKCAQSAISALNGKELDGRKVRVNIAEGKPRAARPKREDKRIEY